jgi:hypothetical protein
MQHTIHNSTPSPFQGTERKTSSQLVRSTRICTSQNRLIDRFPYQARRTPFPKYNLSVFLKGKDHRYALSDLKRRYSLYTMHKKPPSRGHSKEPIYRARAIPVHSSPQFPLLAQLIQHPFHVSTRAVYAKVISISFSLPNSSSSSAHAL